MLINCPCDLQILSEGITWVEWYDLQKKSENDIRMSLSKLLFRMEDSLSLNEIS